MKPIELAEILLDLEGTVEILYSRYNGGEDEYSFTEPVVIVDGDFVTICANNYYEVMAALPGMPFHKADKLVKEAMATGFLDLQKGG